MASRTLKVEIIGDASSFQRALGNATKTSSGLSRAFRGLGIAAAGAGVAIGAGFVYTLKRGFDELADAQKVAAQTSAVIKSTGSAANVSKAQVEGYAEALSLVSGVDDEVIASGENMLLTFKNIRNEAGKGNDIFKQSTAVLLDMSTALGTDMNKSAIQLGKALNDPIKGITALQRVGVSFTAGQKATIASMVEAGDVMGAQKVILKELNSEFGGSAKAFGETMPGQLAKLKNAFDEVAANLAVKFLPVLMGLVQWINTNWGTISAVFDAVGTAITASFKGIGAAVDYLRGQWEIHREAAIAAWEAVRDAVTKFIVFFQTSVLPAIQNVISAAQAIWENFGGEIKAILGRLVATVKAGMQNMLAPIKIILALLRGDWTAAWEELRGVVTRTLGTMVGNIQAILGAAVSIVLALAGKIGKAIVDGIVTVVSGIAGKFKQAFDGVYSILRDVAGKVAGFAGRIVLGIIEPFTHLPSFMGAPFRKAKDAINAQLGIIQSDSGAKASAAGYTIGSFLATGVGAGIAAGAYQAVAAAQAAVAQVVAAAQVAARAKSPSKETEEKVGKPLVEGIGSGIEKGTPKLKEITAATVRAAVGAAQLAAATKQIGGKAVQDIIDGIVGKQPSLTAQFQTAVRDGVAAAQQALADARAGYASAFASLFDAGTAAIAAKYADWQPPALLRKQREAEEREAAALKKSIEDAQKALQAALAAGAALPPLKMGEVPTEEFKAAEKAILDARKSLDDLLFQQEQKRLEEKAAIQQKEHDQMVAAEQKKFAKQLEIIQGQYAKHKITYEQMQAKIKTLLASFDIDFLNAGKAWGNQLAEGIRSARKAVEDAAKLLAQAAKDNTQNNSPKPKKGPLSRKSMYDAGREHGMNWAKGIASAAGAVGKAAATTAGGASGGFGDAKNTGNIFDFGSGTPPPGGFGPDFEGSRPGWADRELWETTAVMAAKLGKFDALIDAVQSGSIKANAGLLSQLFYARTRKTWNDFPARIAKILDDMRGPEGLSSAEAAAKYGLKKGGYVKQDGFAFLHKNEIVTPLPSGGRMSMGSQAININFNGTVMGGTEAQMARVLAPAIENEIRRSQRRGNASIVQAT